MLRAKLHRPWRQAIQLYFSPFLGGKVDEAEEKLKRAIELKPI